FFVPQAHLTDDFKVRFDMIDGTTDAWQIDSVVIEEGPACIPVGNMTASAITSSSATLTFDNIADDYMLEYGPCGFTQGTGTTATGTEPIVISSLLSNSCYDVYVRRDCGTSGLSAWSGPFKFVTECSSFTAPYFNDFENDSLDLPPACWSAYVTGTSAFVEVEDFTGTAAPYSGDQALYLYSGSSSTSGGDTLVAISPQFSDLTAGDKMVSFYANSDDPVSQLIIGTLPSLSPSATFTPIDTITFPTPDTYQEVVVFFTTANGYNGTDEYIALAHSLGATFDYVRIDEFSYDQIPPCPDPSNIILDSALTTSAYFSFNSAGTTSFEWEVGPTGFVQGTGATGLGGNPLTVNNLMPSTTYDVYIRANCTGSGNGFSGWVGPVTFSTSCLTDTLPYYMDFSSGAFPICWTRTDPVDVSVEASCDTRTNVLEFNYTEEAITVDIDASAAQNLKVSYLFAA
ncbi:MAG: hypothetical protein ACPF9D_13195, partial [Owenweeksia sp.]